MTTKTVKIIVKGPYNDENGRAKNLVRDDLLTTIEWYADSLIESKLARKYTEPVKETEPVEPKAEKKSKKKVSKKTEAKSNPFLD